MVSIQESQTNTFSVMQEREIELLHLFLHVPSLFATEVVCHLSAFRRTFLLLVLVSGWIIWHATCTNTESWDMTVSVSFAYVCVCRYSACTTYTRSSQLEGVQKVDQGSLVTTRQVKNTRLATITTRTVLREETLFSCSSIQHDFLNPANKKNIMYICTYWISYNILHVCM